MKQAIEAERPYQDKVNTIEYQVDNIKQNTATIDLSLMHRNHQIFEWNVKEGIVAPANIINRAAFLGDGKTYIEFEKKEGCHYTPALNAQNAEKRLKKRFKIK